jgi:hypothetical protein
MLNERQPGTHTYKQMESSWWDRNWKWFVPVGCLSGLALILGLIAAILFFAFSMMKSSDAFKLAFSKAQASPAVVNSLGEPIKSGLVVSGNINVNGPSGAANLSIPISGPKGEGTVYLKAKSMGEWTFDELVVKIDGTGEKIDLLAESTP